MPTPFLSSATNNWRSIIAVAAVVAAAAAWAFSSTKDGPVGPEPARGSVELPESSLPRASAPGTTTAPESEIVVQVAGAVSTPGLVRLSTGARVQDAIDAAGGVVPDADVDRVNLASKLSDGQRVYILRRGQGVAPEVPGSHDGTGDTSGAPIELNTASVEALDKLPGVGPATAKAIADYRKAHGPFRSVADLAKVKGIGPSKLDQIRPLVRV